MKKIFVLMAVVLVLSLSLPATAANMGLKRVNGQLGILFPSTPNIDYGFNLLLGAGADLGELTDNLILVPNLSYWIMSADPEGGAVSGLDVSASNFQIEVDVQYYLKDVKGLYFGGGPSINFKSITFEYATNIPGLGTGSVSGSKTDVGLGILAGYETMVANSLTGFAHLKYNIVSDMNTFAIVFGVWFDVNN